MKFLEEAIWDLLHEEQFYAHFILNSRIVYDPKGLPTAAASVVRGTPVLLFNTKWVMSHSREQIAAILKHEVLHLLLDHIGRMDKVDKKLYNIAADCAINQHIKDVPAGAVSLDSLSKALKVPLEPFESAEYYYSLIQQHAERVPAQGKGCDTLDDHDYEVEGEEQNPQMRKMAAKNAAESATKAAAGNVPESLQKVLGQMNQDAKLPWKQLLRNFIANATTSLRIHTSKKIHRRLGLEHPGVKKKREMVLGVCVDSSGSVSDEAFTAFFDEIKQIAKQCTVHLIDADCEIHSVVKLNSKSKLKVERHGSGGTAYGPALTKCKELKCDAIVYFGDMDCADTPENPGVPTLWVSVASHNNQPGSFGKLIKL